MSHAMLEVIVCPSVLGAATGTVAGACVGGVAGVLVTGSAGLITRALALTGGIVGGCSGYVFGLAGPTTGSVDTGHDDDHDE